MCKEHLRSLTGLLQPNRQHNARIYEVVRVLVKVMVSNYAKLCYGSGKAIKK